jgi:hypothetical protein
MWLLDTSTVRLHDFMGANIPPYAILSHMWDEGEISFQEIRGSPGILQERLGYIKIRNCCAQANSDGFQYIWIDTCCIDKTNSTALSEAINSMFRYYKEASECYAFLSDVPKGTELHRFKESRWFQRGWTLQELIAPISVVFFNVDWEEIGTKSSLQDIIEDRTHIPKHILSGSRVHHSKPISVAQKMSWAAGRETSCVEDIAYSLLGLFDVHMPMIYGEGEGSFIRLQQEIMKETNDHSLFAWNPTEGGGEVGILAKSPNCFADSGQIICEDTGMDNRGSQAEYFMTNRGLRITLPVDNNNTSYDMMQDMSLRRAHLNCYNTSGQAVAILVKGKTGTQEYVRTGVLQYVTRGAETAARFEEMYLSQTPSKFQPWMQFGTIAPNFKVDYRRVFRYGFSLDAVESTPVSSQDKNSHGRWEDLSRGQVFVHLSQPASESHSTFLCLLFKNSRSGENFAVLSGTFKNRIWLTVEINLGVDKTLQNLLDFYTDGAVKEPFIRCFDRVSKALSDEFVIQTAIKNKVIEGEKLFVLEVNLVYTP